MKTHSSLFLSALALLVIMSLALTGCYRKAAPDVTPTAAAGAESAEVGTPDIQATAAANATLAAPTAAPATGGEQAQPTVPPTRALPTPTAAPKPAATPVPPTPTAQPQPQPTTAPTAAPSSGPTVHTVQAGENLFRIALRYGTTVEAIASANGIANPAMIYVGQELTIPAGGEAAPEGEATYVVQPGDNLFRIALRYNMSYIYLAQYNGISNPANIRVGQILRIPPH